MCYTNHALDQFLEDLLDIGIDRSAIVRLGAKSTQRTQSLGFFEQRSTYKRARTSWDVLHSVEDEAFRFKDKLGESFTTYQNLKPDASTVMDYLEFEEPEFWEAFTLPESDDGMTLVGKGGNAIGKYHLYQEWVKGNGCGKLARSLPASTRRVWTMSKEARHEKHRCWIRALLDEHVATVKTHASQLNRCQKKLDSIWGEKDRDVLKDKRIIGCTTTAAAKYAEHLRSTSPRVVLLEEAGEILESHVLTALSPETKQLVLIGDHQQLRPKINDYALSFEKGNGYDLNVSIFERLIRAGYPHTTLLNQHRMCPEISTLVRNLTYPDLEDAQKTKGRPRPRGLQDRVIFFQHEHQEADFAGISDGRDEGAKLSKRNGFEAEIVLRIVKYLGQQGYGTDKLVVLTPYLGQLHLLQKTLSKQNDPLLNDLDSYDLVRAGLLSQAGANHSKRKIKISTIGK